MRKAQSECKRGHDLTDPANVKPKANGGRQCRVCQREAQRRHAAKARAATPYKVQPIPPGTNTCQVETCDSPRADNGMGGRSRYCRAHVHRLRNHGDLYQDVPVIAAGKSLAARRAELRG